MTTTELHLLKLPPPRRDPLPESRGGTNRLSRKRQVKRHDTTFSRLELTLADPSAYRDHPGAILPERALAFVMRESGHEFSRLLHELTGSEALGEEKAQGIGVGAVTPASRVYWIMPTKESLHRILAIWERYASGKEMGHGQEKWEMLFDHLSDLHPWGPHDQLTEEAALGFRKVLHGDTGHCVRLEAEIWYRGSDQDRIDRSTGFRELIAQAGGKVLDRLEIPENEYLGILAEVDRKVVRGILDNTDSALGAFRMVKRIGPHAKCRHSPERPPGPSGVSDPSETLGPRNPPMAALLDTAPMSGHAMLRNRLVVDDPRGSEGKYPRAVDRIHCTAMASLIIYGDLNSRPIGKALSSKLYVRPVLHPFRETEQSERVLDDTFSLDLIERAFRRMFGDDSATGAMAPTVRVVNLSISAKGESLSDSVTPFGHLLDHLSSKYNVLILVCAGNVPRCLGFKGISWDYLKRLGPADREAAMIRALCESRYRHDRFTPGDSVNSLTIGSRHSDALGAGHPAENILRLHQENDLPNICSAQGFGHMRSIKPEVLFPGGRGHARHWNSSDGPYLEDPAEHYVVSAPAGRHFGVGAASPPNSDADTHERRNCYGTSVSTALATRGACQILESIEEAPQTPPHPDPDSRFFPVIAKAMLVHSARWGQATYQRLLGVLDAMGVPKSQHRDKIAHILGFGAADVDRVLRCAPSRVTLLGWGFVPVNELETRTIPLPPESTDSQDPYRVTVTCAWITPVSPTDRRYCVARISARLVTAPGMPASTPCASQPPGDMCGRGTVFHRLWDVQRRHRDKSIESLTIKMEHRMLRGWSPTNVPYATAVTIEDPSPTPVGLYDWMRDTATTWAEKEASTPGIGRNTARWQHLAPESA